MDSVRLAFGRSYKIFLAVAAVLALQLFAAGKGNLCGAILIGALLNFFYFVSAAARLESVMGMSKEKAKRVMLVGMGLRLAMVCVVLAVAVHISEELFLSTAVCFVGFYLASLWILAQNSFANRY